MGEENPELSEAAKAEIQAAIAILKSDGLHIHKTAEAYARSKETKDDSSGSGNNDSADTEDGEEGKPPPKKEEENEKPAKQGLWWGKRASE